MENEQNQTPEPTGTEANYIEIIKGLKESTVSKSEYERVLNENKTLAEAFVTSPARSAEEQETPHFTQKDINDSARRLMSGHLNNLEFSREALRYRNAVIEVHGKDPFLPNSTGYQANEADVAKAQMIADGLQAMADYAGSDASLFNSELKRNCH